VSDDQQPEFRSLSALYIIIFLNKLKLVENTPTNEKIKIKCLWLRLWGLSEINGPFHGSQFPGPMYRLNPPLMGPFTCHFVSIRSSSTLSPISLKRPSWSWSYGSWIYSYLYNQCLSPLKLRVRIPFMARYT
jgi:hypothetical protein